MKEALKKYLSGSQNAVRDEFILSREKSGKSELVYVQHPELPEPIYKFWHSRSSKKQRKSPKHTGGKKPYVMLMIEELVSLMRQGMPPEPAGYLLYLTPYIEWGTGRLVCGRKKRRMTVVDIEKVFKKKRRATLYIMATLKDHGLLFCTEEGYFISRELIKRGAKIADKI